MHDHPVIEAFYSEAYSLLFDNYNIRNITRRGYSSSANSFEITIPEAEYFNLTTDYDCTSNKISHFTSIRNLFSILNSESLRLYNLLNVNDANEFLEVLPSDKHEDLRRLKKHVFILSACDYNNLDEAEIFNMWRLYGHDGSGVRLELDIDIIDPEKSTFLKKVRYDRRLQIEKFALKVEEIRKRHDLEKIEYIKTLISPSFLHKAPKWKLENEIRLVHYNWDSREFREDHPNPATPFFKDYNPSTNTNCGYLNLKLNDLKSIATVRISKIELGKNYLNKTDEIRNLIEELSIMSLRKKNRLGGTFQVAISEI